MADFLRECNSQGVSPQEFEQVFCQRCRQADCDLAQWGSSLFDRRVATQADRLLKPEQADPRLPKYAQIVGADFTDMLEHAMRLEISDRRGDWEVPETDGVLEVASTATTSAVDNAIRNLARSEGRPEPALPDDEDIVAQAVAQLGENPSEELQKAAEAQEDDAPLGSQEDPSGAKPASLQAPPMPAGNRPPPTLPKKGNIPVPSGGLMVGGGPAAKPPVAADPWAPPSSLTARSKTVPTGARIRMSGSDSEGDQ
jgi:hypothetical protein